MSNYKMPSFPHWVLMLRIQCVLNSLLSSNLNNIQLALHQIHDGLISIDKYSTDMSEKFRKFVCDQLERIIICENQEKILQLIKLRNNIKDYSSFNDKIKQINNIKYKILRWNIKKREILDKTYYIEGMLMTYYFIEVDTAQMVLDELIKDIHKVITGSLIIAKRLREYDNIGSLEVLPNNVLVNISDKIHSGSKINFS